MGLQGSVKAFSLDDLLNFLTASGHHGTLHVFHKDARKILYLHQNMLSIERSSYSFRLGDVLVRRGEITSAQLEEALKLHKERDTRLGNALVELGHTTPERIMEARRHQVEEEIYECFAWEAAFFEFAKGELPADFEQRLTDPEEFRFPVSSLLMEAVRRIDELKMIRTTLPSEKRLYRLAEGGDHAKRAGKALAEAAARVTEPAEVFNGNLSLAAMPYYLGLSRFETQSLLTGLIVAGHVRPFLRHELESRFRVALDDDQDYALRLYECALETPEFDARGRFMDRVLFGNKAFRDSSQEVVRRFSARVRGKRAFEILLGIFRQGVGCEFVVKDEGQELTLLLSKSSLVLRVSEDAETPNVMNYLLARSPVADADMSRVREMQRETGQSLRQILVGGGYVTMENWFRAQKDAVLNEMFNVLLYRRPFVEVKIGAAASDQAGERLDLEVPLLPWLRSEVMTDVRKWETMLATIPSVRGYLMLTPKGMKELKSIHDVWANFDGRRTLEDILGSQPKSPQEFLALVFERLQNGRLEPLAPEEYRRRFQEAVDAGKRPNAIDYCVAAIDSGVEPDYFTEQLAQLEADEAEISVQDTRPTLRGDLASYSLAEVLQSFHLSKRTGSLLVAVEGDRQRQQSLYFEGGQAYLLTGAGEVDQDLEGDLEEELLASGHVTEEQLASAAAQQMKDEVYEMFLWEGAEFEFAADHLPPEFYSSRAHRKIALNTVQFLMGAIRRQSEWEEVREVLPNDQIVLQFVSSQAKMQALADKGTEDLLLLVDGRHPIADLVRISGIRNYAALPLLAELVREGVLQEVDMAAQQEEDEEAIVATDLPTSGVLEEGFVGQLQFVGTLQDMGSAKLTGVLRLTDGRRSKEMALIDGVPYRTAAYHPRAEPEEGADLSEASSEDAAQDVSECFSWSGARFELLQGTLPPRLQDEEKRVPYELDPDVFFDAFAEAAERWGMVAELIPREKCLAYVSDMARDRAERKAGEHEQLVALVDGKNSAEDIARMSGVRFHAFAWLADLFENELVEVVEPPESGEDEDEWDFSL
jgi:hypothetical protein